MEESTPKKSIPAGLIAGIAAAALVVAAVGGYFGLCAWVKGNDQLLPGAVAVDDRGETVADLGRKLFDYVVEVASGREVKAEEAGFHDMAIFKQGVTL